MRKLLLSAPDKASRRYVETFEREAASERVMKGCLAPFVLFAVAGWLIFVALLLVAEGFHWRGFDLGDGVLAAAVGATAIFGLLGIILRHYYPGKPR